MIDRGLSEEYLIVWMEHAGPANDYDQATHMESHMRIAGRCGRANASRSLFDFYDLFASRWPPAVAAEALRRVLLALAEEDPRRVP